MQVDTQLTIATTNGQNTFTLDVLDHNEKSFHESVLSFLKENDSSFNDESFAPSFNLVDWSEELEVMNLVSKEYGISKDIWELSLMSYGEISMLYAWYRLQRNSGTDIIDNIRQAEDAYIGYFENDDELFRHMLDEGNLSYEEEQFLKQLTEPSKVKEYFVNQTESYQHCYFRA